MEIKHRDEKEQYAPPAIIDISPVCSVVKGDSGFDEGDNEN